MATERVQFILGDRLISNLRYRAKIEPLRWAIARGVNIDNIPRIDFGNSRENSFITAQISDGLISIPQAYHRGIARQQTILQGQ